MIRLATIRDGFTWQMGIVMMTMAMIMMTITMMMIKTMTFGGDDDGEDGDLHE